MIPGYLSNLVLVFALCHAHSLRRLSASFISPPSRLLGDLQESSSDPQQLGVGSWGEVYRGSLDGRAVAVKLPRGDSSNVIPDIRAYLLMKRDGVDMSGFAAVLGYLRVKDRLGHDGPMEDPNLTLEYMNLDDLESTEDLNAALRVLKVLEQAVGGVGGLRTVGDGGNAVDKVYGVVMELCTGGSLDHARETHSIEYLVSVLLGAYMTVQDMHRHGYVVRDFKPDNVMIEDDTAKLIDLGLIHSIEQEDHLEAYQGSAAYQYNGNTLTLQNFGYFDRFAIGMTLVKLVLPELFSTIGRQLSDHISVWSLTQFLSTLHIRSKKLHGFQRMGNSVVSSSSDEIFTSISMGVWDIIDAALLPRNMEESTRRSRRELAMSPYSVEAYDAAEETIGTVDEESKYHVEESSLLQEVAADKFLQLALEKFSRNLNLKDTSSTSVLQDKVWTYQWSSWNFAKTSTEGYGEPGMFYSDSNSNILLWRSTNTDLSISYADVSTKDMSLESMSTSCSSLQVHHDSKEFRSKLVAVEGVLLHMFSINPLGTFATRPGAFSPINRDHIRTKCKESDLDKELMQLNFPFCDHTGRVYVPDEFKNSKYLAELRIRVDLTSEESIEFLYYLYDAIVMIISRGKASYPRAYLVGLVRLSDHLSSAVGVSNRFLQLISDMGPELMSDPSCTVFFHLGNQYSVFTTLQ